MEMIDFEKDRKRANPLERRQSWKDSRKERFKGCPIGKDVQAYFSNRLVVLDLRGQVLNDKVKGFTHVVFEKKAMVRAGELNSSDSSLKCRK
ncbi:MAG: hypothetical protein NTX61_15940 [Bacteroidetes bacterium]|nr:hypothetical protein [Bacteroidota bacterium]